MSKTLTVPIGPNASLDGGPFNQFQGLGEDENAAGSDVLAGEDDTGEEWEVHLSDIEDALNSEMRDSQPIRLSTGDCRDAVIGNVRVPMLEGYTVELHCLPGQGTDKRAHLLNLRDDVVRRRHFERKLPVHGGRIQG